MKGLRLRAFAPALAIALILAACGGGGSSASQADLQLQSVRATPQAACSYAHVFVTVTAVRVLSDSNGWQEIALAGPRRIDLLATGGGVLQALGLAPLQPGHFMQVRLILADSGNTVQPTGGTEAPLNVPSGSSSGFKLRGDITVAPGTAADVALSGFDPCTAIVVTGNGSFNLKPEATMQAVAVAGPEVPGAPGTVLPIPGGGFALATNSGGTWTLQRFDASGNTVGGPATIVTPPGTTTTFIFFAALTGGGYAAVWIQPTFRMGVVQVQTQAWDATGAALGPVLGVAETTPGRLSHPPALPQISPLAGGGYALVWGLTGTSDDVEAQRFTADGAPAAPAVVAAASGTGPLGVTGLAAGGYLVTWGQFGSPSGAVQAYSATDVPLAPTQLAGPNGDGGGPPIPVVRALTGGGAVIAWQATGQHLMVQQVAADGTPVTAAQIVDDQTAVPVFDIVAIGALPDGGSVIAWTQTDGNAFARRFLASGAPAGPQTKINLVTTGASGPVGVTVMADGSFAIRWTATGSGGVSGTFVRTFPANALTG